MSDFKAKMHQNPIYSAPLYPLAGFKGPTSKGMGGDRRGGDGRRGEERGVEWMGGRGGEGSVVESKKILKIDPGVPLTHIFPVACVVGSCHRTTEGRFHSVVVEQLSARCDHFL